MQPELHCFTKQTAGFKLLFCQIYNSSFITESAFVFNAYTLIGCAKGKNQAVYMQFRSGLSFLVMIGKEGLDFLPSSQILCPAGCCFSLYSDSKFRFYTSCGLGIVTWRWFEKFSVQCWILESLREDATLLTVHRNNWHHWMGFFEVFQWSDAHEERIEE